MYYHLLLTRRCNLNCIYCGGSEESYGDPEIQYSLEDLNRFIEKDPDPVIAFYGGEPLLRIPLMERITDTIPAKHYILQTNGCFLDKVGEDYLKRFHSILVSIDGREETTDSYRGKGIYRRIIKNGKMVRDRGYQGDLIARMTISENSDVYEDVTYLLKLQNPAFNHVHWQLDVVWSKEGEWHNFDEWVKNSYNPGISKLVKDWYEEMETNGKILGIVPFIPVMKTLLTGEKSLLRCGSGINFFAIHPSGVITACPISSDPELVVGNIWNSHPLELRNSMMVGPPCPECEIYWICGGRCLYANMKKHWGEEGFKKVCGTVKHLIKELENIKTKIVKLINKKMLSLKYFNYPEINNCCEIIP
ncbi:MAG: TIGR04084 family radical SAM/SPASM domain-containing protein [Candidatus Lokiarchaeia archaeon]